MSQSTRLRSPAPPTTEKASSSTSQPASTSTTTTPPSRPSNTTPAVPPRTIYKLLLFTLAMFTAPLLFYYLSINLLFHGNATYAGAGAAGVANLVLFGYIFAAVMEDGSDEVGSGVGGKGGKVE